MVNSFLWGLLNFFFCPLSIWWWGGLEEVVIVTGQHNFQKLQLVHYNNGEIFTALDFSIPGCAWTKSYAGKIQGALWVCCFILVGWLVGVFFLKVFKRFTDRMRTFNPYPWKRHYCSTSNSYLSTVYATKVPRLPPHSMLNTCLPEQETTYRVGNTKEKHVFELPPLLGPQIDTYKAGFLPENCRYLEEGAKLKAKLVQAPWKVKKILTENKFCLCWVTCRSAVSHQCLYCWEAELCREPDWDISGSSWVMGKNSRVHWLPLRAAA